jgi:hypothetical protein
MYTEWKSKGWSFSFFNPVPLLFMAYTFRVVLLTPGSVAACFFHTDEGKSGVLSPLPVSSINATIPVEGSTGFIGFTGFMGFTGEVQEVEAPPHPTLAIPTKSNIRNKAAPIMSFRMTIPLFAMESPTRAI